MNWNLCISIVLIVTHELAPFSWAFLYCCSDLSVFLLFDCQLRNIRSTIQRSRKINYLCLPPQSVFSLISQQIFAIKILSYDFMISTISIVMTKYTFSTSKYWTKINDLNFFPRFFFSFVIVVKTGKWNCGSSLEARRRFGLHLSAAC